MNNNIKYIKGKLFTSNSQTLVNTINCVGVMGAGIALEFKYRYPMMFNKYVIYCKENLIDIGKLWIYEIPKSKKKILNFPTKKHWKHPSKYEYLELGLNRFVNTYKEKNITSVAFPLLGAQNGGLEPQRVLDIMYKHLSKCEIPVEIYEYDEKSPDDLYSDFKYTFLSYDINKLEFLTGFHKNTIFKIKDTLEKENFTSLIQLHKAQGIGEETLKECFKFALEQKYNHLNSYEIKENNKFNDLILFRINSSPQTVYNSLTVAEKIKLTGLEKETISKIENGKDEVSIKELKAYCNSLNLDFTDFIKSKFVNM